MTTGNVPWSMTGSLSTAPAQVDEHPISGMQRTQRWHRIVVCLIVIFSAFLNFYLIQQNGYGNEFYAAAVRSMLESWHNFFFASFDPGGFVTVDKPAFGLWIQALSAEIAQLLGFGFSSISLLIPQAIAGTLSVYVLYCIVRRVFGPGAAIFAALALAITPITVTMNRDNNLDPLLVFFLLLAFWCAVVSVDSGRLRWLLLAAVMVGLGFNIKTLEAYLVVPAIGLYYLLSAPYGWRKRIVHLVLALLVLLIVSFAWLVTVDLTPASERPYVGSSQTNSEIELAFGYNGLERLTGMSNGTGGGGAPAGNITQRSDSGYTNGSTAPKTTSTPKATGTPGAAGGAPGATGTPGATGGAPGAMGTPGATGGGPGAMGTPGAAGGGPGATGTPGAAQRSGTPGASGTAPATENVNSGTFSPPSGTGGPGGGTGGTSIFNEGGAPSVFRLFEVNLGGQVSWLLPLALLGLLAMFWQAPFRWNPFNRWHQGAILWGVWLVTCGGFFSVAGFYHSYYLVTLAPPICALAGIGLVTLWYDYRTRSRADWRSWLLPIALICTAAEQVYLLSGYGAPYATILSPVIIITTIVGVLILALAKLQLNIRLNLKPLRWPATIVVMLGLFATPFVWSAISVATPGNAVLPTGGPTLASSGFGGGFGGGGADGGRNFTFTGYEVAQTGEFPGNGYQTGAGAGAENRTGAGYAAYVANIGNAGGAPSTSNIGQGGQSDAQLEKFLLANRGQARFILAVPSAGSAEQMIIDTGAPVMAMGGFSGSDPILSTKTLSQLVKAGEVRYFQVSGGGMGGSSQITSWIESKCKTVASSKYSSSTSSSQTGFGGAGGALYDCASAS